MNTQFLDAKIAYYSEDLYQYLMQMHEIEPNFTFGLRERNPTMSKINRIAQGFWFQGSSYIFISPYKRGDSKNKTRTIGFVVHPGMNETICKLEIVFPNETDTRFINCYQEIAQAFGTGVFSTANIFKMQYPSGEVKHLLKQFIENDKPRIDAIIRKHSLQQYFFITPQEFIKIKQKNDKFRKDFIEHRGLLVEDDELLEYLEGKERKALREHKSRERSREFVRDFKKGHQDILLCPGCDQNLKNIYGIDSIKLLELHHIIPFSKIEGEYKIKKKDAILLCPTCHRAIHRYMSNDKINRIDLNEFRIKMQLNKEQSNSV